MKLFTLALLLTALFLLTGCLATETKIYRCTLNADGSGQGTITYVNIFSQDDGDKDVSADDFKELIDDYLNGAKFEDETPRVHVTGKRLYEENGKLYGEVTYTFSNPDSAGFILTPGCQCCPIIFAAGSNETVIETNGKAMGGDTPVLTWPAGTKDLWYKVSIASDSTGTHPLIERYRAWKAEKK